MSKEGGSGGAGSQDAGGGAPNDPAKDALFETREPKKIVRIITVLAYMFSVSFVAIVLSAYYLFLWEPPNPRLLHAASRLREGPRIHYLRGDPPHEKTSIHEKLDDNSFNLDRDEASQKLTSYNKDYDNFYETLVSLRSSLNDVLRERSNDSSNSIDRNLTENLSNDSSSIDRNLTENLSKDSFSIDRNLTENLTNDLSSSDRIKIDGEREKTLSNDNANVRKDIPQEAEFIPGDKSGINDNTTRTLLHRRKEKDGYEEPTTSTTTTLRQVSEYVVKRHRFLWNLSNNELTKSNDEQSNYDGSRNTNGGRGGGREDEKKDAKTTETQIEKVTARSSMINDTLESSEMSTTFREKSLIEMLTETTKSKGVSLYELSSAAPTKIEMVDAVTISESYEESPSQN